MVLVLVLGERRKMYICCGIVPSSIGACSTLARPVPIWWEDDPDPEDALFNNPTARAPIPPAPPAECPLPVGGTVTMGTPHIVQAYVPVEALYPGTFCA